MYLPPSISLHCILIPSWVVTTLGWWYNIVAEDLVCFVVWNKGSAGICNLVKRGLWSRITFETLTNNICIKIHGVHWCQEKNSGVSWFQENNYDVILVVFISLILMNRRKKYTSYRYYRNVILITKWSFYRV